MDGFPFGYERIAETTWAYMSSLMMLALFFKFNRFWTVRNFDLVLIILLAPGILLIQGGNQYLAENSAFKVPTVPQVEAQETALPDGTNGQIVETEEPENPILEKANALRFWGYIWLFSVGVLFLIRMLLDPNLVRRPVLEPNLSVGGLTFLACSLMIFLFANVVTSQPTQDDLRGARDAVKMLQRDAAGADETELLKRSGPGYTLFNLFPVIPSFGDGEAILETDPDKQQNMGKYVVAAKSLAIMTQIFLVVGLVLCGYWYFNSFSTGIGMAVVYLMLPYTAVYTGHVLHSLPGALLVWAIAFIRRPFLAGVFIGLAISVSYYPIFLLPLWMSFYWENGLRRFLIGAFVAVLICVIGLIFTSIDVTAFLSQLRAMFGFWAPLMDGLEGIWALGWDHSFRLPIMVAFIALAVSFAFWPEQKTVSTLISYTCALMVGVQFWHGFGGGEFMAWYVPMALMIFFRPNMEGRVATFELNRAQDERLMKATREMAEEIPI